MFGLDLPARPAFTGALTRGKGGSHTHMTRQRGRWRDAAFGLTVFLAAIAPVERAGAQDEPAHFHHVHLNVVDPDATIQFYRRYFSAVPIQYRQRAPALLTDRSFLLLTKVETRAPKLERTALWHIGWGGVDGPAEFEYRQKAGLRFETPVTPLGNQYYFYVYGPDDEVVEVWTGFNHNRFGHVHLFADDVNATARWYKEWLLLEGHRRDVPRPTATPSPDWRPGDMSIFATLWTTQVMTPNCTINIFGKPGPEKVVWWPYEPIVDFEPTDGHVIDHIAFSFRKIDPVLARMRQAGVEIVDEPRLRSEYGMRSFFVRGPDKVLVEIVEERPLPDGVWDE